MTNEAEARAALVAVLAALAKQRQKEPIFDIGAPFLRLATAYMDSWRAVFQPIVAAFQDMGRLLARGWHVGVAMRVVMPGYVARARMLRTPALPAPEVIQSEGEEQGE